MKGRKNKGKKKSGIWLSTTNYNVPYCAVSERKHRLTVQRIEVSRNILHPVWYKLHVQTMERQVQAMVYTYAVKETVPHKHPQE